jgi:hypothetical protein
LPACSPILDQKVPESFFRLSSDATAHVDAVLRLFEGGAFADDLRRVLVAGVHNAILRAASNEFGPASDIVF